MERLESAPRLELERSGSNLFKKSGYTPVLLKEPVQKRVI
jgi:hypothetical protein